ncbi:hypothetical protein HZB01_00410 [Candidatus Woesearchaeota archaeon]|nr:hypothetical protein [Candidatus Woesearchaeota archaeon]
MSNHQSRGIILLFAFLLVFSSLAEALTLNSFASQITNQQGVVVDNTEYLPFGLVMDGGRERLLFTGKELEDGTSLYYLGLFITTDRKAP